MQQALATGEATIQSLREALKVEETRRHKLEFEVACASTAEADVERLMVRVASLEKNLAEVRKASALRCMHTLLFRSVRTHQPAGFWFDRAHVYSPLRWPLFGDGGVDQCSCCVYSIASDTIAAQHLVPFFSSFSSPSGGRSTQTRFKRGSAVGLFFRFFPRIGTAGAFLRLTGGVRSGVLRLAATLLCRM